MSRLQQENFKAIIQEYLDAEEDFSLYENGRELWITLPGDNCRSLVIKPNGTWRLE